ncbi:amine oxidase [Penicillium manginii]|uniref:amine oxidase n=1 Tax=Penicillium manginii TaxID=203109 RepID=UPI0025478F8E|nr:amine oxidase [Penicillium manginii]KAJ5739529.1 amine oxidase [Penicillium manginii]
MTDIPGPNPRELSREGSSVGELCTPPEKRNSCPDTYDVIVIGAGYAGLRAARDLATYNRKVLLLEARDRVGGRTYTVEGDEDGFLYEMGGTYVTHHFGYVLGELQRYKMDRDLIVSHQEGYENNYYTLNVEGAPARNVSHEEAGQITSSAWDLFVDIDGNSCRNICPLPHSQLDNIMVSRADVEAIDKISCKERIDQIKHLLTAEQLGTLSAVIMLVTGGKLENSSLWECIRTHALLIHDSANLADLWTTYKLREGQSAFARRIFDDAVDFGLEYAFKTPVTAIADEIDSTEGRVKVTTANNGIFRSHRVISTIPLNILKTVQFSPPLSPKRQEAINLGHINFMTKIHAVVEGSGLASWNGMCSPGYIAQGYGDGVTAQGSAHIVGFGGDERENFTPEHEPEKVIAAFQALHPMNVEKTVFHNWCTDPWANGGPAWWAPEYMSKYQDELQKRHGAILFASGDWAHGWRASIDGAIEQGALCAIEALRDLRLTDVSHDHQPKL